MRKYYPRGRFDFRLQPLPDYGCIYVKNAKAGTSTIMLWLHRVHTDDHGFTPARNIHREHAIPRTTEVGWRRVCRMLDGEAFRFSFVRDPIRRVESAYRDKVAGAPDVDGNRVAKLRRVLGITGPLTFDHFLGALELLDPLDMDPHWRPQHLNLMHPLVEYDLVGRLENFAADLARCRRRPASPMCRSRSGTRQSNRRRACSTGTRTCCARRATCTPATSSSTATDRPRPRAAVRRRRVSDAIVPRGAAAGVPPNRRKRRSFAPEGA